MKQYPMNETIVTTSKLSKEYVRDEFHVVALDAVDINAASASTTTTWR